MEYLGHYIKKYIRTEKVVLKKIVFVFIIKRYSALSAGEKNIANLEVIKVLQDYYGVNLPIFSDNAESITIKYDMPSQIIELYAQKGKTLDNVVKIEDIYKGE